MNRNSGLTFSRYPGTLRGSAFLAVLFVSLILGMGKRAASQTTHLDTLFAQIISNTVATVQNGEVSVGGDSLLAPLIRLVAVKPVVCAPVLFLEQAAAKVIPKDSTAEMTVTLHATLLNPGNPLARPLDWEFTREIPWTARDRTLLDAGRSKYVSVGRPPEKSFWATTLEPALVVLGAAAIVALFFLVRS